MSTQVERALKRALSGKLAKDPPKPKGLTQRGPEDLAVGSVVFVSDTPEGLPDYLFEGGAVSDDERYIYWALLKELGQPIQGGEEVWRYQQPPLGGRHLSGGLVADFVVDPNRVSRPRPLAIRVVSYRFHLAAGSVVEAYDREQVDVLYEYGYEVIDVYSQDFLSDPTGNAAREVTRDALAGIQRPNPDALGIVFDPA
jgi:hypothetical protein